MYEVIVERTFAAAHALRNYQGGCENLHGHNFRVQVRVEGPNLDEAGLLVDFLELKRAMDAVIDPYEHQNLNETAPFDDLNPSAENIARWFHDRIQDGIAARLAEVRVWETEWSSAAYRPK
jgi:6-pyruvoyltetrahydropterin/6-carboxytetrahydropterin synthase